jgi:hypothetical protein
MLLKAPRWMDERQVAEFVRFVGDLAECCHASAAPVFKRFAELCIMAEDPAKSRGNEQHIEHEKMLCCAMLRLSAARPPGGGCHRNSQRAFGTGGGSRTE